MYGYIYKTTNLVNGKIYIGQHKSNVFEPNKYFGSGILITQAIIKYGIENFVCELLKECNSQEELNEYEIYFIALFKSTDKSIGYNITDGGKCITITDLEYFEKIRPKLQHIGKENPNCKYSLEQCNLVKSLLDEGMKIPDIASFTGVGTSVVARIRQGLHWSCINDHYVCNAKVKATYKTKRLSTEEKSSRRKERSALAKIKKEQEFLSTEHFCLFCGTKITKLIGKGLFCSKSCGYKYGAYHRDNTNMRIAIKNRDYRGDKNPNFGKRASNELREKISTNIKSSDKYKNVLESSRFHGHSHSEESKRKISESLKRTRRTKDE